jgi:hypothetical protein
VIMAKKDLGLTDSHSIEEAAERHSLKMKLRGRKGA